MGVGFWALGSGFWIQDLGFRGFICETVWGPSPF